jgi:peptidoglycan hydrolase-like protein with peptidoglycan-binding domain
LTGAEQAWLILSKQLCQPVSAGRKCGRKPAACLESKGSVNREWCNFVWNGAAVRLPPGERLPGPDMREELPKHVRRNRILPVTAWSLTAVMALAIVGNALFGQQSKPVPAQAGLEPQAESDPAVPQVGVRTIQLKFDPVVEAVQRELITAGYYKGIADGVNGRKTRQAVKAYQEAVGLKPDGQPTAELAEHIRFTRAVAQAALFTGTIEAAPDADIRAAIRRVQTALTELSYSPGAVDGELTRQTRDAIIAFQRDRNMPQTGEINDALMAELGKAGAQAEAQSP